MGIMFDLSAIAEENRAQFVTLDDPRSLASAKRANARLREEPCYFTPTGEAMLFFCIATKIGWEINNQNIEEFIARIRVIEALEGPALLNTGRGAMLESTIRAAMGLQINAGYQPRDEWLMQIFARNYPACDLEDCGTEHYSVSAKDEYGELFECEVWAVDQRQAVTKAGRMFRGWAGEDLDLPPTWEWSVVAMRAD